MIDLAYDISDIYVKVRMGKGGREEKQDEDGIIKGRLRASYMAKAQARDVPSVQLSVIIDRLFRSSQGFLVGINLPTFGGRVATYGNTTDLQVLGLICGFSMVGTGHYSSELRMRYRSCGASCLMGDG